MKHPPLPRIKKPKPPSKKELRIMYQKALQLVKSYADDTEVF